MEDLAKQLSSLLDSPEGMDKIKALAESLLGGENADTPEAPASPAADIPALPAAELETFMKISRVLKSGKDDDRARLLLALRPHLSPERQLKVDKAVKLLKLVEILPLLRESGFDLF